MSAQDAVDSSFVEYQCSTRQRVVAVLMSSMLMVGVVIVIVSNLTHHDISSAIIRDCLASQFVFLALRTSVPIFSYRLHANADGICETRFRKVTRVCWGEVAGYRLEPVPYRGSPTTWPVLYGASGQALLRPSCPYLYKAGDDQRRLEAFWRFVEEQLTGKKIEGQPSSIDSLFSPSRS